MLEDARPAPMAPIGNGREKLHEHWLRSHSFAHDAIATGLAVGVTRLALSHLIPADDPDHTEGHWRAAAPGDLGEMELIIGRDGLKIPLA